MNKKDETKRLEKIVKVLLKYDLKKGITPDKLCNIIEELGPTFIKIGQILSTRIDIIPRDYIDSLSKLRSNVKQISKEEIESILDTEYKNKDEVFESIDELLGTGSIAQVHMATLKNKEKVVIKVCKKNVYEQMMLDVSLMKKAIKILHLNKLIKVIDLNKVLDEILEVAYEESNFNIEKEHLIKFKKLNINDSNISSPKVYSNISTNKVLVMEYIDGILLDKIELLNKEGYDLEKISYILSDNYIKQALNDGFFHADPHPNNIMIRKNAITYIDLGMMGTLENKNKELLNKCIMKIIEEDYYEVAKILVLMCEKTGDVDMPKLKKDISNILSSSATSNLNEIDITKFTSDMFLMLKENNLTLDKDITMLVRGIIIIEATLSSLNPNLNLISVLINHIKSNNEKIIDKNKIIEMGTSAIKNTKSLINIPSEILTFFETINNGDNKIKFEMSASSKSVDKIEKLLHELIIGIIDASLILSLSNEENKVLRIIIIVLIIILSVWLFMKMLFDHIHKGY